jgi:hypothetical protein
VFLLNDRYRASVVSKQKQVTAGGLRWAGCTFGMAKRFGFGLASINRTLTTISKDVLPSSS